MLWTEGFETPDFWNRWHSDGGLWMLGSPTLGPTKPFAGAQCAGTLMDLDFPAGRDTRLIRDRVFLVPPGAQTPRLRFWQWFRGAVGATRTVELRVGAGSWQALSPVSGWTGDDWTRATFDLSAFSGQTVQLAFHFVTATDAEPAAGWFLDDVTLETGQAVAELVGSPQGFESGLGNWRVENGTWEVGVPVVGPQRAAAGTNCAGTILAGDYPPGADSRMLSPIFEVPPESENARLRFWHWFAIAPEDVARVEVAVNGGAWQALSPNFTYSSAVWSRPSFDLRPFAGQDIQLAFHLQSDLGLSVGRGWYVDDVVVETGPSFWDPQLETEGFEQGLRHWSVDSGTWETGAPGFGPEGAAEGKLCAGTGLNTPYVRHVDSRLVSPPFSLPKAGSAAQLRFLHWYDIAAGDEGAVEARKPGGDWQPISTVVTGASQGWKLAACDLSGYINTTIQIAFHFRSNQDAIVRAGWYLDQVQVTRTEVEPPPSPFQLTVERTTAELLSLCLNGAGAHADYVLEACDDMAADADPSRWTELRTIDPDVCEMVYSSSQAERFFRVREVKPTNNAATAVEDISLR